MVEKLERATDWTKKTVSPFEVSIVLTAICVATAGGIIGANCWAIYWTFDGTNCVAIW